MKNYKQWKGWNRDNFARLSASGGNYYRAEMKRAGVLSLKGLKVVEIGFGRGEFAAYATASGADYFGVEIDADLVAMAKDRGIRAGSSIGEFGGLADLVVGWDVIEHLTIGQVEDFLRAVHSVLGESGKLLLRFPSGDSPFSGPIFRGDITHMTLLGSSAVRQLAKNHDYRVQFLAAPCTPLVGVSFARKVKRLLILAVRQATFALIRYFLMGSGRGLVLAPNMVACLTPKVTEDR